MEQSPPSDLIARNLTPKERANVSRVSFAFWSMVKANSAVLEYQEKKDAKNAAKENELIIFDKVKKIAALLAGTEMRTMPDEIKSVGKLRYTPKSVKRKFPAEESLASIFDIKINETLFPLENSRTMMQANLLFELISDPLKTYLDNYNKTVGAQITEVNQIPPAVVCCTELFTLLHRYPDQFKLKGWDSELNNLILCFREKLFPSMLQYVIDYPSAVDSELAFARIKSYVALGVNLNAHFKYSAFQCTFLMLAVAQNDDDLVNLFLSNKADPNMEAYYRFHKRRTPLTLAIKQNSLKIVVLLLKRDVKLIIDNRVLVNIETDFIDAFAEAIEQGNCEILKKLFVFAHEKELSISRERYNAYFNYAIRNNLADILVVLIDFFGKGKLERVYCPSVSECNLSTLSVLMSTGIDLSNIFRSKSTTLLIEAAKQYDLNKIKLLVLSGENVDAVDMYKQPAKHYAYLQAVKVGATKPWFRSKLTKDEIYYQEMVSILSDPKKFIQESKSKNAKPVLEEKEVKPGEIKQLRP